MSHVAYPEQTCVCYVSGSKVGVAAVSVDFSSFSELYSEVQATIGAKLFTVSAVTPDNSQVFRAFSSDEQTYPVGGLKPAGDLTTDAARASEFHPTKQQILDLFPDHDVILALGCTTAINIPVVVDDVVIGSVNFLDEEGNYTQESVSVAEDLTRRAYPLVIEAVGAKRAV